MCGNETLVVMLLDARNLTLADGADICEREYCTTVMAVCDHLVQYVITLLLADGTTIGSALLLRQWFRSCARV
jgi:hypothetical protein